MICQFCGYEFDDRCGKYGCPNCNAEGLDDRRREEMKRLIICTILIIAGIEFGGMAYDKMSASINADMQQKIQQITER